jgi:hypothetical protein
MGIFYNMDSQGKPKQSINRADQGNLGNENPMISEIPKTVRRAARSIPRPLGQGGSTQFDFTWVRIPWRYLSDKL